jgi:hypothetical protein
MKLFKLTLAVYLCLCSGCAVYWDDEIFIGTCMKDYDLKNLTSTSNKVKAKATVEMPPTIEVESN